MTFLRKYLPLLCSLLTALWLFAASVGMLGACIEQLAAGQAPAVAGLAAQVRAVHGHDSVVSHSANVPDAGERLACAKQCATDLGGVLKPSQPDIGQLAVLVFAVLSLVRLPLQQTATHAWRIASGLAAAGTPPPTIRFHRFNN